MYPDDSPYVEQSGTQYRLALSQSLDKSNTLVTELTRLNTNQSNNSSNVFVFQVTGSRLPTASGQYSVDLLADAPAGQLWGSAHYLFGDLHQRWAFVTASYSGSIISQDRAYVFGTNEVTITDYTGSDQIGKYITYNN